MNQWPTWIGDLPAWITTIAVLIAARQYVGERTRRREEAEREARAQATRLTAWAVTDAHDGKAWGVRLSNTSGSTFHDVHIEAKMQDHEVKRAIDLRIVPPGDLFVRYKSESGTWALAVGADGRSLDALTATDKFSVTRMRFSDNRNQAWSTDDSAVLRAEA